MGFNPYSKFYRMSSSVETPMIVSLLQLKENFFCVFNGIQITHMCVLYCIVFSTEGGERDFCSKIVCTGSRLCMRGLFCFTTEIIGI